MNRTSIVSIVALLVIAAAFGVWVWYAKPIVKGPAFQHPLAGEMIGEGLYQYTEDKPHYHIEVSYPVGTSLKGSADVVARSYMEGELAKAVAAFKQENNLDNLTAQDIEMQGLGGDRKYTFTMEFQPYAWEGTISFVYSVYADTLGAHPNSFYRTFVFSSDGTPLDLEDLFTPGSNYLTLLSKFAYDGVVAQLAQKTGSEPTPQMLDEVRIGTAPSPETLQFYYLNNTDSGGELVLLFPPYQVAAYAAGSFEVHIALSSLKDILKPGIQ
ncbi:MAG TPA: DUF3298 domain-containing protein [Candidatus Paceibacterota bacterium]|nr:DUF3298 domain-containing protein [Candidatus Paceibacterota bacterium]